MTPEQIAEAVAWARMAVHDMGNKEFPLVETERALLAEHERTERLERRVQELGDELDKRDEYIQANAQDAARWREVRQEMRVYVDDDGEPWLHLDVHVKGLPVDWDSQTCSATVDEAADRLIAEQEAQNEK